MSVCIQVPEGLLEENISEYLHGLGVGNDF